MKVSVIVPIYNVEKYIRQCIISILNQTLDSLEIILVNDGSLDNSINEIQDLIDNNKSIKLINKENGGLSSARNAGIKVANGEYIVFIDSDDYIKPDFLEKLYSEAKEYQLDVAIGGFTKLLSNNIEEKFIRNSVLFDLGTVEGCEFLLKELLIDDYRMEVWKSLYSRQFLELNNLFFIDGLFHEDEEFTPKVLMLANRVKLVDTYGYIYRQREQSIMTVRPRKEHIESVLFIIKKLVLEFNTTDIQKHKIIYSKLIRYLIACYEQKVLLSDLKDRKNKLLIIKTNNIRQIINYNKDVELKTNFKYLLLDISPTLYYFYLKTRF